MEMKKSLMIFAASTMLLFAACNKEESNGYTINGDKITFGLNMDDTQSSDKQTFAGNYKQIWFNSNDQIYVNQVAYNVVPQVSEDYFESTTSVSPLAKVTASISADGRYDFVYPANAIQFDGTNYTATFPAQVQALNGATFNTFDNNLIRLVGDELPIWPMYYGITDIANQHNRIVLKNACAFLSPVFIYGPNWANKVFAPLTGVSYGANSPCPNFYLHEGRIMSNIKLHGAAHLDYSNMNQPIMVVDDAMPTSGRQVVLFTAPANQTIRENQNNTEVQNIAGIIPIAPAQNFDTKNFRMAFSFWTNLEIPASDGVAAHTETIVMCFVTNASETTNPIMRNNRYAMEVNFQTLGENFGGYEGGLDTYVQNRGGIIHFGNGDLWVGSTVEGARAFLATYADMTE